MGDETEPSQTDKILNAILLELQKKEESEETKKLKEIINYLSFIGQALKQQFSEIQDIKRAVKAMERQ